MILAYNSGMATLSRDTSQQTERVLLELLRAKPPAERIRMASELTQWVRDMVKTSIRERYPGADECEFRARFAAVWLGRRWAIAVYGWDPERHGW